MSKFLFHVVHTTEKQVIRTGTTACEMCKNEKRAGRAKRAKLLFSSLNMPISCRRLGVYLRSLMLAPNLYLTVV